MLRILPMDPTPIGKAGQKKMVTHLVIGASVKGQAVVLVTDYDKKTVGPYILSEEREALVGVPEDILAQITAEIEANPITIPNPKAV